MPAARGCGTPSGRNRNTPPPDRLPSAGSGELFAERGGRVPCPRLCVGMRGNRTPGGSPEVPMPTQSGGQGTQPYENTSPQTALVPVPATSFRRTDFQAVRGGRTDWKSVLRKEKTSLEPALGSALLRDSPSAAAPSRGRARRGRARFGISGAPVATYRGGVYHPLMGTDSPARTPPHARQD